MSVLSNETVDENMTKKLRARSFAAQKYSTFTYVQFA